MGKRPGVVEHVERRAATQPSILAYVQSQAVGLDPNLINVSATWNPNNAPGSIVTVTVNYTIKPLAGLAIKQNIPISSTAQFVINH